MRTLLALFILVTLACSKDNEGATPAKFDSSTLVEISKSFCATGESLIELNLDPVPLPFSSIQAPGTLIGFVKGSGTCAIAQDINDSWSSGIFGITINANCIPNGSIWKFTSNTSTGDTIHYFLDSADPSGLPQIEVWGTQSLNTTYARDHAGLRVMKCSTSSSKPTH